MITELGTFTSPATADFAAIPQRDFMLKDRYGNGICQRQLLSILGGVGAGGKSVLTVCMAISLATGQSFGPWVPKQAYTVAMLNAEDDMDEINRRVDAALRSPDNFNGITQSDLERLHVISATKGMTLVTKQKNKTGIELTPFYKWLLPQFKTREVEFAFFDPLVELSEGTNENDNAEMHAVIATFRQVTISLNMHTMLVHHFRKGTGVDSTSRVRGAGAMTALSRMNINVEELSKDDCDTYGISAADMHDIFRVVVGKSNHGKNGSSFLMRKSEQVISNGETTVSLEQFTPVQTESGLPADKLAEFLKTLHIGRGDGCLYLVAKQGGSDMGRANGMLKLKFGVSLKSANEIIERLCADGTLVQREFVRARHVYLGYAVPSLETLETPTYN